MFDRKEIKKEAKESISHHYFRNVIVVFICSVALAGGFTYSSKNFLETDRASEKIESLVSRKQKISNSEIINNLLEKTSKEKKEDKKFESKFSRGILAVFANEINSSRSIVFGILNGFNKLLFGDKISVGILILISTLLIYAFNIIFVNVLVIGENRYFLEQRKYRNTKVDKLLFPYRTKKTLHIAYILFMKSLYQFFWNLTIVFGFIKNYEYYFVPYVLAENLNISKKEAFRLSKQLSKGEKWNLFKLDLSFIGWHILSLLTFKISSIFYSDVYYEATKASLYMSIRDKRRKKIDDGKLLNDKLLDRKDIKDDTYPVEEFSISSNKVRDWLKVDYDKDYSLQTYILFFFTFSFIGFLWEVSLHLVSDGVFVNRGTMYGPWLPIYGWGGILILVLLKKFRDNPWKLFVMAVIVCGVLEYTTAWYLDVFRHTKYWDYSGYFLNIQGRICLEGLLVFGLGGCGFTYLLAPVLDNIYSKINYNIKYIFCIIFLITFSVDFVISTIKPNSGEGISDYEDNRIARDNIIYIGGEM